MKNERPLNRTAKAFSAAYCGFLRANQKIDRMPYGRCEAKPTAKHSLRFTVGFFNNVPLSQSRRYAQILFLKILTVYPWLKFLTALDLNEIEGFPMFSKNIKGGYSASM